MPAKIFIVVKSPVCVCKHFASSVFFSSDFVFFIFWFLSVVKFLLKDIEIFELKRKKQRGSTLFILAHGLSLHLFIIRNNGYCVITTDRKYPKYSNENSSIFLLCRQSAKHWTRKKNREGYIISYQLSVSILASLPYTFVFVFNFK